MVVKKEKCETKITLTSRATASLFHRLMSLKAMKKMGHFKHCYLL